MRTLKLIYRSEQELKAYLSEHRLSSGRGIVQLFSGRSPDETLHVQRMLKASLPHFVLIGTSTAGEIYRGTCVSEAIVIDIIMFETEIEVIPFYSALTAGIDTIHTLPPRLHPKVMICFANALQDSAEPLLSSLNQQYPDSLVTGGYAADNNVFHSTFTLLEDKLYQQGLVGIALSGEKLQTSLISYRGWHPIGQKFTVTSVKNNVLYSLDNTPVLEIYRKYLGEHVLSGFPNTVMEFPLLVKRGQQQFLRAPVGITSDKQGVILAGNLQVNDQVYFSFADLHGLSTEVQQLEQQSGIAPLIYSCAARKTFMQQQIEQEVSKLGTLNQANGCFLYGEFATEQQHFSLHNLSSTLLVLAEQAETIELQFTTLRSNTAKPNSLQTLAFLAKTTGVELNEAMIFLEQQQYALNYSSIVSMTDPHGNITYVNKKFEEISGYKSHELLGKNHRIIKNPAMPAKVHHSLWRTISQKKPWQGLMLNKRKDGSGYYVKTVVVPLLDEQQNISSFLSIRQDITDVVKARQTIKMHTTDALTGLPNRTKLSVDLKNQQRTALAMIDVRNFKLVNDVWGMEHGDDIIKTIAGRLKEYSYYLRIEPYRINGATFALLAATNLDTTVFIRRCEKLKAHIEEHSVDVDAKSFDITLSMGVGISETHALALAESALTDAKLSYTTISVVKTEHDLTSNRAYSCIEEVRNALAEQRLTAVFQRLAYVKDTFQNTTKYEALVRINTKDGSLLSPGEFLQHIKKTRLYGALTREVVTISVDTANLLNCIISVNLSIQDIVDQQTKNFIFDKLHQYGGANMIFEITESEAIQDFNSVADFIKQVRKFGAKIAIDDFGSGYSNFAYLVEIKPDYIKIDGSIIKTIVKNENSRLVTKSIIDMARSLNIKTIAEFVSEQAILDCLTELNVDMVQGFHIAKPLPIGQLNNERILN